MSTFIPSQAPVTPRAAQSKAEAEQAAPKAGYTVKKGDTLGKIARGLLEQNGTPGKAEIAKMVDTLKSLNPNLCTPARKGGHLLLPGDPVVLPQRPPAQEPGWTPGSKPSRDAAPDATLADQAAAQQQMAALSSEQEKAKAALGQQLEVVAGVLGERPELNQGQRDFLSDLVARAKEKGLGDSPAALAIAAKLSAPPQGAAPVAGAREPAPPLGSGPGARSRALMQQMESDPDSALNVKLRAANITPKVPFSQAIGVLADPRKLAGLSDAAIENALHDAIDFAVDHYVAHGGQGSPFFKTIELIPQRADGLRDRMLGDDPLNLRPGGALSIEVPRSEARSLSADDLHSAWNAGKQFDDSTVRRAWPLVNPVGPLRSALRETVKDAGQRLGLDLGGLKQRLLTGDTSARAAVAALAEQHLPADAKTLNGGGDLRAAAKAKLEGASNEELARIVDGWKRNVESGDFRDEVVGQVIDVASEAHPNIRSHAYGLIAVANSHQIDVKADATFGATSVRRFVSKSASDRSVDVRAVGLIAVSTQDTINVQASISALKSPSAAVVASEALARALQL